MPKSDSQESIEEEHEACGERGFGGGAVEGDAFSPASKQYVQKAKLDAEISQHGPSYERGGREDRPVIGGKDRGQENGEQAGDTEQHAVEQHAILLLRLV